MTEVARDGSLEPFVLVVSEVSGWSGLLDRALTSTKIMHGLADSLKSGQDRLAGDHDPLVTGVITDAWAGGWPTIVDAAKEIGAYTALVTRSGITLREAKRLQVPAFMKNEFEHTTQVRRNQALRNLIQAVVPPAIYETPIRLGNQKE